MVASVIGAALSLVAKGVKAGTTAYDKKQREKMAEAQTAETNEFNADVNKFNQKVAADKAAEEWKEKLRQNLQSKKAASSKRIADILQRTQGTGRSDINDYKEEPRENLQGIAGAGNSDIAGYNKGGIV